MLAILPTTALFLISLLLPGSLPDPSTPGTLTMGAYLEAIVMDREEKVHVSIEYQLSKKPGIGSISYAGLEAFDTKINNIWAIFNSNKVQLTPESENLKIAGKFELPEVHTQDSTVTFKLSYELSNAKHNGNHHFDINIPVICQLIPFTRHINI